MRKSAASGPRGSNVVFVGNIPYELTEEQLTDVFKEVGPVLKFRLMFDRDTGRPRGYGFCEYHDAETAASAVRNLNNVEVGGRALRVDYADGDPAAAANASAPEDKSLPDQRATAESGGPAQPLSPPQQAQQQPQQHAQQSAGPAPATGATQSAVDTITKTLAAMNPNQLFEVLSQIKLLVQTNVDQARQLLTQNPQLSYALFQAMLLVHVVEPSVLQRILQSSLQQVQSQQPPGQSSTALVNQQFPQNVSNPPAAVAQPQQQQQYTGVPQQPPGSMMQQPMQPMQQQPMQQPIQQPMQQPMQPPMGVPVMPTGGMVPVMSGGVPQQPASVGGTTAAGQNMNDMQLQEQHKLLLQVLQLSQEQINSLPPDQRQNIMQLKAQIMLSQT